MVDWWKTRGYNPDIYMETMNTLIDTLSSSTETLLCRSTMGLTLSRDARATVFLGTGSLSGRAARWRSDLVAGASLPPLLPPPPFPLSKCPSLLPKAEARGKV